MTRRHITTLLALLVAAASSGCRLGTDCDTGIEPALDVVIVDAQTGEPLADSAIGFVQSGTFVDSLVPNRSDGSGQLLSRATTKTPPGTYSVHVTHEGYEPWDLSNVRVQTGTCGMETRILTAELQPLGAP